MLKQKHIAFYSFVKRQWVLLSLVYAVTNIDTVTKHARAKSALQLLRHKQSLSEVYIHYVKLYNI